MAEKKVTGGQTYFSVQNDMRPKNMKCQYNATLLPSLNAMNDIKIPFIAIKSMLRMNKQVSKRVRLSGQVGGWMDGWRDKQTN